LRSGALPKTAVAISRRGRRRIWIQQSKKSTAYDGFYSHPATITRLGLEPGPVQPRGYRMEAGALPDLSRVAARGPIYADRSRTLRGEGRLPAGTSLIGRAWVSVPPASLARPRSSITYG
jgi:hypothetical protein